VGWGVDRILRVQGGYRGYRRVYVVGGVGWRVWREVRGGGREREGAGEGNPHRRERSRTEPNTREQLPNARSRTATNSDEHSSPMLNSAEQDPTNVVEQ
jgi:hypothetical protein